MFSYVIIGFMVFLATWAIANIAFWYKNRRVSGYMGYFWQMNALWNIINIIIALVATVLVLINLNSYNTSESLQLLQIRIVAINILLDLVYVGVGLFLESRGKLKTNQRMQGYGMAIQLQGAFLFFFDTIFTLALLVVII
jgi:hypothetical protein